MPSDQFTACENHDRLNAVEQTIASIQTSNKTWGIAIGGIMSGAAIIAVPFLFWLSSSVSAHETAINVVRTKMENQEAKVAEMAADIKAILAELRKHP